MYVCMYYFLSTPVFANGVAKKGLSDHYVCLGCSGSFVLNVADLQLTLDYYQDINFPACATDISTEICDAVVSGGGNPCKS